MRLASHPGFPYEPGTKDIHVPGMSHVSISSFRLGYVSACTSSIPLLFLCSSCNQESWPAANWDVFNWVKI